MRRDGRVDDDGMMGGIVLMVESRVEKSAGPKTGGVSSGKRKDGSINLNEAEPEPEPTSAVRNLLKAA